MLKELKNKFKRWLNTPPNKEDLFGVHIRETYQKLFECKHDYIHEDAWCHGENHGKDLYRRKCKWCGDYQIMVYNRFGPIRTEWRSFNS
jgi:hypothetical protein